MRCKIKRILILVVVTTACAFHASGGFVTTWGGISNTSPGNLTMDGSSNVYVVGGFNGTTDFDPGTATNSHKAGGSRDAFISKFNSDGTWLWTKTWGSSNDDRANSVAVYGSNVYVAGCFQDTVDFNPSGGDPHSAPRGTNGFPNNDAFLCGYDTNGNYKWTTTWGGNGGDEAYDVAVDGSGFVYVCGDFSSTNMDLTPLGGIGSRTNNGQWDAFIFKFDGGGTSVWAKTWGGIYYDDCTCIAVTEEGDTYGGGMFASPIADFDPGPATNYLYAHNATNFGNVDVFLSKLDSQGNFLWARAWGQSNGWDAAQGVAVASSNVYVPGYFSHTVDFNPLGVPTNVTSHGSNDAFLCKYDSAGNFKWVRTWGRVHGRLGARRRGGWCGVCVRARGYQVHQCRFRPGARSRPSLLTRCRGYHPEQVRRRRELHAGEDLRGERERRRMGGRGRGRIGQRIRGGELRGVGRLRPVDRRDDKPAVLRHF